MPSPPVPVRTAAARAGTSTTAEGADEAAGGAGPPGPGRRGLSTPSGPAAALAALTDRQRERLVTGGVAVATLAVYLRSLMPGIGFSGDAAKWQLLSEVGGVPHATGYPLYVALIQLFGLLTPFGSAAWRTNLFSALCAVAAIAVLYRLLRLLGVRPGVAAAAALTFAFTRDFWTQAVIAEVYALHILLLVALLTCLARWRLVPDDDGGGGDGSDGGGVGSDWWLRAGIGLLALSFGNHLTTVLVVPGVAWLVWSDRRRALTRDNVLWAGAAAVLGASQYLYLLYMTRVGGYVESPVHSLGDLAELVTGGPFRDQMFAFGPVALVTDRVPLLLDLVRDEYLVLLLAPIGLGLWQVFRRGGWTDGRRDVAIALALLGAGAAVYGMNYDVPDVVVFFLPLFLVLAVFLGIGLDGAVDWVATRPWTRSPSGRHHAPRDAARDGRDARNDRLARIGVAATLVAVPLVTGLVDYRSASQRGTTADAERIEAALDAIGRHAVILTDNYNDSEYFWYHLLGEGMAESRDLALVHEATPQQVLDYFAGRPSAVATAAAGIDGAGSAAGARPPLFTASPRQPEAMAGAGLEVTRFAPGVWRIDPDRRQAGATLPFGTTLDLGPPVTASYGSGLLDIYYPDASFTGPRPLVVYVHGGGWFHGSRADVRCDAATEPELRACVPATELARGYVVASIDYRLLTADPLRNRFPAPVEDVKQAVLWLREHAAEHRIDPGRVVLVGHSAGATLAALAALTPGEWEPRPGYETHVDGFVSLVGPTSLEDWAAWLDDHGQFDEAAITRRLVGCDIGGGVGAGECTARLAEASPADPRWADPDDPPGYLVCEVSDPVVPCDQLWALYATLFAAHDGDHTAVVVDVARHAPDRAEDDDPHNPDTDLDLPALQAFLDRATA